MINADDFYGRDAFEKAAKFLTEEVSPKKYCIIGYHLSKTLSENGTVSRGVCDVDANGNLVSIVERQKFFLKMIKYFMLKMRFRVPLPADTPVSMNFWGFDPNVFDFIQKLFIRFLKENIENPKAEFFIPIIGDAYIHRSRKGK